MARVGVKTKLSPDRWAQLMGFHPLFFNGIFVPNVIEPSNTDLFWPQYSWQLSDQVSREDLAAAIAEAEANIEKALGYKLVPAWETDEWKPSIRPYKPELVNQSGTDLRGYNQIVKAEWGHFIVGGVMGKTRVQDGVVITWVDEDGDTYKEAGYVDVATSFDDCEIALYYPGKNQAEEWEIDVTKVTDLGGGAKRVYFSRNQCVLSTKYEGFAEYNAIDGSDDTNFITTIDVYRKYNDPQTQVTFMWEPLGECDCGSSTCPQCSYTQQNGCLGVRGDPSMSLVFYQPGTWNETTEEFDAAEWAVTSRIPDIIRLYYYAGLRDKNLSCPKKEMRYDWQRVVAYYAASLLDRAVPAPSNVRDFVGRWQKDLAFTSGATELASYNLSDSDLDSPFGTRAGAVAAWRKVKQEALAKYA